LGFLAFKDAFGRWLEETYLAEQFDFQCFRFWAQLQEQNVLSPILNRMVLQHAVDIVSKALAQILQLSNRRVEEVPSTGHITLGFNVSHVDMTVGTLYQLEVVGCRQSLPCHRAQCVKFLIGRQLNHIEAVKDCIVWDQKLLVAEVKQFVKWLVVALPEANDFPPVVAWGTFYSIMGFTLQESGLAIVAGKLPDFFRSLVDEAKVYEGVVRKLGADQILLVEREANCNRVRVNRKELSHLRVEPDGRALTED
jgi:hypothetical protein